MTFNRQLEYICTEIVKIRLRLIKKLSWIKTEKSSSVVNHAGKIDTDNSSCKINRKHWFIQGYVTALPTPCPSLTVCCFILPMILPGTLLLLSITGDNQFLN